MSRLGYSIKVPILIIFTPSGRNAGDGGPRLEDLKFPVSLLITILYSWSIDVYFFLYFIFFILFFLIEVWRPPFHNEAYLTFAAVVESKHLWERDIPRPHSCNNASCHGHVTRTVTVAETVPFLYLAEFAHAHYHPRVLSYLGNLSIGCRDVSISNCFMEFTIVFTLLVTVF